MMRYILLLCALFICQNVFAAVMTLECGYPKYSDDSGLHNSEGFGMSFISDTESGKSYIKGNNGSSEVMSLSRDDGGINFIELSDTGNVMLTTVLQGGASVHSRNSAIAGKFVTSQYYGNCEVK